MTEDQIKRTASAMGLTPKQVRKLTATLLGSQYGKGSAQPAHNLHRATRSNPTGNTQLKPSRSARQLSDSAYTDEPVSVIRKAAGF